MAQPRAPDAHETIELLVEVLSGEDDLDQAAFYSRLAEGVCRIADLRRAVIFRYDDAIRRVRPAGAWGIELARFVELPISLEGAPDAARALSEDRVIEVRPAGTHAIPPPLAELVGNHPLVYVPMAGAGRWPGIIVAEPAVGSPPLDDARREMLWTLGKTLALVSTARIATFHGERARELEERIDFARELHDRVVQRLFGVTMALSPPAALDHAARERCVEELQIALGDLRAALQRPLRRVARRTDTTLGAELRRLATEHPDLALRVQGAVPELPPELEPLAQSVLTEAVRNVRKHADARSLVVRVRRGGGVLVLEVENDGVSRGTATKPPGMGLRLTALEALQAGGLLEFGEREPGRWQVRLAVPDPVAG